VTIVTARKDHHQIEGIIVTRLFFGILTAFIVTVSVQADELNSSLATSAYLKKPFGGEQQHQNELRYGVRFDQTSTPLTPDTQVTALQSPAIVDMEFAQTDLSAFRVHGYNALPHYTVVNANGTGGADWTPLLYLGGTALGMCLAGSTLCEPSKNPDTVTAPPPAPCLLGDIRYGLAECIN